ncbi:MAG: alpha-glucan family phosphorylase [Candidatus Binatia bacterium]
MDDPQSLAAQLHQLAWNLWWTWQPEVVAIFRDLDPVLWREQNHNPIAFLAALPADQIEQRAAEIALESRINNAFRQLDEYLRERHTLGSTACGILQRSPVAYFAAEFALHESMPMYSGGLGVLAGDHLKAASDLGVPLVGVGVFYAQGYFRQRIDTTGWQEESYGLVDLHTLPLRRAMGRYGRPVVIEIPLDSERLLIGAWRAEVGRATLVLLDSDVEGNSPANRALTAHLYGGDERERLLQEIVLGIGGIRMLGALGMQPGVLHLNEGHSVLAALELARQRKVADGVAFAVAHRDVSLRTVFTTHTPVPAGHDRFAPELVLQHLGWLQREVGISPEDFFALGRVNPRDSSERFCMTVLGLKSARYANAVSALHGHVTRQMWQNLWPGRPEAEVPIGHITNGVHTNSWLAPSMFTLYARRIGPDWQRQMCNPEAWQKIEALVDAEFWEVHQAVKRRMLNYVLRRCLLRSPSEPAPCVPALDVNVLTLCFARRFTEYKRPALLFSDPDRLATLVSEPGRGLQIIMAGKAHPRDDYAKRVLQQVLDLTQDPRFRDRITFIEDYDFGVGRHLVQGCDVWLNTPRRPFEACGTSGQKVLLNGGLNLSVVDGWWAEAYDRENGFAIGEEHVHSDPAVQDARDAASLYDALENQVIPLYYHRDAVNVPHAWVTRMKRAVVTLAAYFNADRMVRDYVRDCYLPAAGGVPNAMPGMKTGSAMRNLV